APPLGCTNEPARLQRIRPPRDPLGWLHPTRGEGRSQPGQQCHQPDVCDSACLAAPARSVVDVLGGAPPREEIFTSAAKHRGMPSTAAGPRPREEILLSAANY